MSDILERLEAERTAAKSRLKLETVDIKAEQAKPYDDRDEANIPHRIVWARSAYAILVDGEKRGFLVCEGAWRSTRWEVHDLRDRGDGKLLYSGDKDKVLKLADWLARDFDPEKYPTKAEIEAAEAAAKRRRAEREAAYEKEQAERRQAAQRHRAAAQTALDGLSEIEGLELTNYQRHALAFAIGEVRKIAE